MHRAARPLLTGAVAAVLAGSGVAALALTGKGGTPAPPTGMTPAAVSTFADCDALLTHLRTKAASLVGPYGLGDQLMHVMGAREDAVAPAVGTKGGANTGGSPASPASGLPVEQVDGVHEADMMGRTADGLLVTLTQSPPSANGPGGQVLRVTRLDPSTRRAQVLGSLQLNGFWSTSLLVSGSTAVVLGTAGRQDMAVSSPAEKPPHSPTPPPTPPATPAPTPLLHLPAPSAPMAGRLVELDLSDPTHPRAVRMLDAGGDVVQARSVGTQLRVAVTRATTELPWVYPSSDSEQARDRAEQANRDLVLHADLDTWLPSATLTDLAADGTAQGKPRRTRLLDCSALAAPSTFAGLGTVSLVTADLARGGLAQWDAAGLLATGTTLYATPTTTYVAATDWTPPATGAKAAVAAPKGRTQIHAFATDPTALAGGTHYLASGEVPGTLLSQWAMDEHDGVLRVASTLTNGAVAIMEGEAASSVAGGDATVSGPDAPDSPARPAISSAPRDDNRITLLRRDGTRLAPVSVLSGFGRGESIRGVRFVGDVGYVVTYRQTDPLYTLDLRDAAHPAVRGELKLLGYSSFLQPVGPGRLLGVGRSGDADGGTTGVQVSLFDVSDPAHPRRLSSAGVLGAWSDVEADHHAFTVGDGLALTTYSRWGEVTPVGKGIAVGEPRPTAPPQWTEFDAGVLAVAIDGDTLTTHLLRPLSDGPTRIRVDLGDGQAPDAASELAQRAIPQRTLVQDGVIWTLTDAGIAAHDATTFQRLGFTRF